ncbi:Gamma-tubulin complex component 2 [Hibiscus syriacus]|uniref:Gamma-tubulin complex component 2 n=1 Tax=Hibiscus syriacus TaxID=106335 RepID=A0A6A2XDI7_HIBSY|nr:Gamma-tubulin complex component 2 [Hibiscus syriacus]
MDIAREELLKKHDEISVEKLQSLLDLALRTTAAAADPCHEDLSCCVERSSVLKGLSRLKDLDIKNVCHSNDLEEPISITGLETFSLSYKGMYPLLVSLLDDVISFKTRNPKYRFSTFAFVHFKREEDLKRAVEELNGIVIDGRKISVSPARFKDERSRSRVLLSSSNNDDGQISAESSKSRDRDNINRSRRDDRSYRDALLSNGNRRGNNGLMSEDIQRRNVKGNIFEMHIPTDSANWEMLELWSKKEEVLKQWFERVEPLLNEAGKPMAFCMAELKGVPLLCGMNPSSRSWLVDGAVGYTLGSYGRSYKVSIKIGSASEYSSSFFSNFPVEDSGEIFFEERMSEKDEDRLLSVHGEGETCAAGENRLSVDNWIDQGVFHVSGGASEDRQLARLSLDRKDIKCGLSESQTVGKFKVGEYAGLGIRSQNYSADGSQAHSEESGQTGGVSKGMESSPIVEKPFSVEIDPEEENLRPSEQVEGRRYWYGDLLNISSETGDAVVKQRELDVDSRREIEGYFSEGGGHKSKSGLLIRRKRRTKRILYREALDKVSIDTASSSAFSILLKEAVETWELVICSWNVRGLGKNEKRRAVQNLVSNFNPTFLWLQETKTEKFRKSFFRRSGINKLKGILESPSVGSAGGLLCCWDDNVFELENQFVSRRFIATFGKFRSIDSGCGFINVYGPSVEEEKSGFFEELSSFLSGQTYPICVGGDFNVYLQEDEKWEGVKVGVQWRSLMSSFSIRSGKDSQNEAGVFSLMRNTKHAIKKWSGNRVKYPGALISELEKKISLIEDDIQQKQGTVDSEVLVELKNLRAELWKLYRIQEQIWFQYSRTKWIVDGDRNTKYFHTCATIRNKRNALLALNFKGETVEDPTAIKAIVKEYFFKIYNERTTLEIDDLNLDFPRIFLEQKQFLEQEFSEEEVWEVVKSCGSNKAPGPDGFNLGFFKRFWQVLKVDIMKFFHDFYLGKEWEHGVNHTFITLIPKISNIGGLDDFRPISLVGGLYKILSKCLSRRLRSCISDLISPRCVFKADFKKAYDTLDWPILFRIMKEMGFGSRWIGWISKCVTSATVSVLVNGVPTEEIPMARGLRQGCSLSPLLFNIVGELLNLLIAKAVSRGLFSGLVPASVYKTLNSIMSNFLWGGGDGRKRIHWVVNRALLEKWAWRFAIEREAVWRELLCIKYKLDPSLMQFDSKVSPKLSWMWRDMVRNHYNADSLGCSIRGKYSFKIGNGRSIRFWQDNWTMVHPLMLRRELNDWEFEQWANLMVVISDFSISADATDGLFWKGNGEGVYTVKSCVNLSYSGSPDSEEAKFWKSNVWREAKRFLLAWNDLKSNSLIWPFIPGAVLWTIWKTRNFIVFEGGKLDRAEIFFLARCRLASWFLAKETHVSISKDDIIADPSIVDSYSSHSYRVSTVFPWSPPPKGFVKLNVDAATSSDWKRSGLGGILKDMSSSILGSFKEPAGPGPPTLMELKAILKGLDFFESIRHRVKDRLIIESDSQVAVDWIKDVVSCPVVYVQIVKDIIQKLSVFEGYIRWIQWPLSIVISRKALTKYQLIFRFLFHCKHVERQLCGAWQMHQGVRALNYGGTAISRSSLLCRSMLRFINSLLHYLTFEAGFFVLEPNWHVMHGRLQTAKSIDEVIQHHDFFLNKCLKECLLLLPELIKKVEKLKSLCLQYAAATQWLISSSIDIPKLDEQCDGSGASEKKQWKTKNPSQALKVMTRNSAVTDSILKFESEFNAELQSLKPILSSSSQVEPYLTHLAKWLLGVGNDH